MSGAFDKSNQRGMTLISVLVTSVIAVIVMLAIMTSIHNNDKATRNTRQTIDFIEVENLVNMTLLNGDSCKASFQQSFPGAVIGPAITNKPMQLGTKDKLGAFVQYIAQGPIGNIVVNKLQIESDPIALSTPNLFAADITLEASKAGSDNLGGSVFQTKTFKIQISTDATGKINQCGGGGLQQIYNCVGGYEKVIKGTGVESHGISEPGPFLYDDTKFDSVFTTIVYGTKSALDLGISAYFETDPNAKQFWGLLCNPGWQATSCNFFSEGYTSSPGGDSDAFRVNNGCLSDDEEHAFGGTLTTSCCKMGGP